MGKFVLEKNGNFEGFLTLQDIKTTLDLKLKCDANLFIKNFKQVPQPFKYYLQCEQRGYD